MRKLIILLAATLAVTLTVAASLAGAQESGPTDQRCADIITSIKGVSLLPSGGYAVDEDFATAIAQREGVTVETVRTCVERFNAGELPIASPAPPPAPQEDPGMGEFIRGTAGFDRLSGTVGDDRIVGLGSGDVISEGYGDDTLYGGAGWDYVVGGYGDDALYGGTGSDWLDGGAGNDYVKGDAGDDLVDGGTGDDLVTGWSGDDAVYGYAGSDALYGDTGNDLVYSAGDGTYDEVHGGPGYDVCIVGSEDYVDGCEEVYYGG